MLIPIGFLSFGDYWIASLSSAGEDAGRSIKLDSQNNVIVVGYTGSPGSGTGEIFLAKYNNFGVLLWQRTLGGSLEDSGRGLVIDSADNIYLAGYTGSSGQGNNDFIIAKYDSSGAIQWQRTLGTSNQDLAYSIALDSAGSLYVSGYRSTPTIFSIAIIAKYNSSGTLQWQKELSGTFSEFSSVGVDSADGVYALGRSTTGNALIAKYNTSGVLQWQRFLTAADTTSFNAIAFDSSNNVYVTGQTISSPNSFEILIAKYNSSGTLQWQRALGRGSVDTGDGIAIDSNNDVYVVGSSFTANYALVIAKYNSSGTIQWQRTLDSNQGDQGFAITVDANNNLYVSGVSRGDAIIAKLPTDGSLTGTYTLAGNSYTYAASTLNTFTPTLSSSTASLTDGTPSMVSATSSLTSATSSLTSASVEI
jgi:uncharacterized delta-60 repeat protein